ncbi:hypothetical protein N7530_003219 [Penicillium desertorum]|uniref:Isoprenoid synthase domain-containing protein n=1 Tax=Penicillium desertorum TaxID=1303715 RepID=A0A9X0BPA1_9EURO|nr:hypothetical protein N7530_003219 [Penicillium desertorum]
MLPRHGLCEYQKRKSHPELRTCYVKLKRKDATLNMDIPHHDLISIPEKEDTDNEAVNSKAALESVASLHVDFRLAAVPSWMDMTKEEFLAQAIGEVETISLFFPEVRAEHVRVCMAAWLGVICTVDDLLEQMTPSEAEAAIEISVAALYGKESTEEKSASISLVGEVYSLMSTFRKHCCRYLSEEAAKGFFYEIDKVFTGFVEEIRFRQGHTTRDLERYMDLRTRTIGVAPFFALKAVNMTVGLQNDLVGLEKDLENGELLNAVLVAVEQQGEEGKEQDLAKAIEAICALHNQNIAGVVRTRQRVVLEGKGNPAAIIANSQLLFTETHFRWCTTAKRYNAEPEESRD